MEDESEITKLLSKDEKFGFGEVKSEEQYVGPPEYKPLEPDSGLKKRLLLTLVIIIIIAVAVFLIFFMSVFQEQHGLVGYWDFNEESGNILYDKSGNNNNGKILGATWTSGKSGYALEFNGVSDYVDLGNLGLSTSKGTIAAWIYPKEIHCCEQIFSARDNYSQNNVQLYLNERSEVGFYIAKGGMHVVSINNPITPNAWNHVVVTQDGNTCTMYINGVIQQNTDSGEWFDDLPGLNEYAIGRMRWLPNYYFNGTIDDVRIYNYALSADEIANIQ